MKKIETFIAEDGASFENAYDCAKHEFQTIPNLVEKIEEAVKKKPASHQLRWCSPGAGGCACMGCINYQFREAGLTKEHWHIWVNEYREPTIEDDIDFYNSKTNYQVQLVGFEDRSALIKILREETKKTPKEIMEVINGQENILLNTKEYYYIKKLEEKCKENGVQTQILKDGVLMVPKKKMRI